MKRAWGGPWLFAVALAAGATALLLWSWLRDPSRVEAPTIEPSENWNWEVIDNRTGALVASFQEKAEVLTANSALGGSIEVLVQLPGRRWPGSVTGEIHAFPASPDFPLTLDKRWPRHAQVRTDDTRVEPGKQDRVQMDGETRVIGWERVSVPAGEFDALRLEGEFRWQARSGTLRGSERVTTWYAPQAKRAVKVEHVVQADGDARPFRNETLRLVACQVHPKWMSGVAAPPGSPAQLFTFAVYGFLAPSLTLWLAHRLRVKQMREGESATLARQDWVKALVSGIIATIVVPSLISFVLMSRMIGNMERVATLQAVGPHGLLAVLLLVLQAFGLALWYAGFVARQKIVGFSDAFYAASAAMVACGVFNLGALSVW